MNQKELFISKLFLDHREFDWHLLPSSPSSHPSAVIPLSENVNSARTAETREALSVSQCCASRSQHLPVT